MAKSKSVTKVCEQCGQSYAPHRAAVRTSRFCSYACMGASRRGPANYNWKGGSIYRGYRHICVDGRPILEHRYIMQEHLGRPLASNEIVHHLNGNSLDNRIANLVMIPGHSAHQAEHRVAYVSDTHRECTKCWLIKPKSEFPYLARVRDHCSSSCRTCQSAARLAYRHLHQQSLRYNRRASKRPLDVI